jgi:hypothetical protein
VYEPDEAVSGSVARRGNTAATTEAAATTATADASATPCVVEAGSSCGLAASQVWGVTISYKKICVISAKMVYALPETAIFL